MQTAANNNVAMQTPARQSIRQNQQLQTTHNLPVVSEERPKKTTRLNTQGKLSLTAYDQYSANVIVNLDDLIDGLCKNLVCKTSELLILMIRH